MSKKVLGDFQTPLPLVREILSVLTSMPVEWGRVLEPTCGTGNFIRGLLELERPPHEIVGIERQTTYFEQVRALAPDCAHRGIRLDVLQANIFDIDLGKDITWKSQTPLLVVGNPPWVTNAELGARGSDNLPAKSNFKGWRGIEAITGGANFDITETILIKLITELVHEQATVALLCKTSVARNLLHYAHQANLPLGDASIRRIDAKRWFDAAVDACLFTLAVDRGATGYEADVFPSLTATVPAQSIGFVGRSMVSDIARYRAVAFADGASPIEWRQGLKHDAASVMELVFEDNVWRNKLGEVVEVEDAYVYPLIKGSDVRRIRSSLPRRAVIVTQQAAGQDTTFLKHQAPRLWAYLTRHADVFAARKSSIYQGKAPFSIFGIGPYSFAPYKVIISGLYKQPHFVAVGPQDGKPIMCDDTCYLLPLETAAQAAVITAILNHPTTAHLIESLVFWDAKRPITKSLLSRIDFGALLHHIPVEEISESSKKILSGLLNEAYFEDIPTPDEVLASLVQIEQLPLL